MGLLIKVNNIPQIRQTAKSLPQDILKQAAADEKPVLKYSGIFQQGRNVFS